jgi:hypothetical protein
MLQIFIHIRKLASKTVIEQSRTKKEVILEISFKNSPFLIVLEILGEEDKQLLQLLQT